MYTAIIFQKGVRKEFKLKQCKTYAVPTPRRNQKVNIILHLSLINLQPRNAPKVMCRSITHYVWDMSLAVKQN